MNIKDFLFLPLLFFFGSQAEARNIYFATYVPMSLQNLGYSAANQWVGDCANCHRTAAGGQVGVPDLNTMFGRDFYAFNANTGTDFPQTEIQRIIQGIEGTDSDGDTFTNLQEYRARTNPNNPISRPTVQGDGGNTEDPGDYFKNGSAGGGNNRVMNSDELYSLSGCGSTDTSPMDRASFGISLKRDGEWYALGGSMFGLWFLPIIVLLFARKRKPQ